MTDAINSYLSVSNFITSIKMRKLFHHPLLILNLSTCNLKLCLRHICQFNGTVVKGTEEPAQLCRFAKTRHERSVWAALNPILAPL